MVDAVTPLLQVSDLTTTFRTEGGIVRAVSGVSFTVERGEVIGIVGESGSGKSVSALSLMRLIPSPSGQITAREIIFDGRDLLLLSESEMRRVRGNEIAMIFQEPLTALNPVFTIGDQISEPLRLHQKLSRVAARIRAAELLRAVGVPNPDRRLDAHPHQLSGGLRQRVMIAMALSCQPKLLIADEPTTALDVSIQAQILELLRALQAGSGTSLIFITHDLGVVAELCDRVIVMYAGRVVEQATTRRLFATPRHPYTHGLLACLPRVEQPPGTRLIPIMGQPPNLLRPPRGCTFHPRCPHAFERCRLEEPPLFVLADGQLARCWLHETAARGVETSHHGPAGEHAALGADRAGAHFLSTVSIRSPADSVGTSMVVEVSPRPDDGRPSLVGPSSDRQALLVARNLKKYFPITAGVLRRHVADVKAVDGVSFSVGRGETLSLVGESGCGKSTTGRLLLRLIEPTSGDVTFDGASVTTLSGPNLRALRRRMQIIFQDPYSSLNPRRTVGSIVAQPLEIHGIAKGKNAQVRVAEILELVGLNPAHVDRYPHEFSGGQRQRIGVARAIAAEPSFIVADEPVSALDVSIQAQVINLLRDLQNRLGLSYLFISHNLSVVRAISDRVAVMYLGQIVELAPNAEIYRTPLHPYTKALLTAVPTIDPRTGAARIVLPGDVPSPINPPAGCRFHTRCPFAMELCRSVAPVLAAAGGGHLVACHLYPRGESPTPSRKRTEQS